LSLDRSARATEALSAVLADGRGFAERLTQMRRCKDAILADPAPKPSCKRLLIRPSAGLHGPKFAGKQSRVLASHSEYDQRTGVAYDCRTNLV